MKNVVFKSAYVVIALLAIITIMPAKTVQANEVKESVLVVIGPAGQWFTEKIDPEFRQKMSEKGIVLDQTLMENATLERMKNYNVVLYYGAPAQDDSESLKACKKFAADVKEYITSGGGFIFLDNAFRQYAKGANAITEDFGIHFTGQPVDDEVIVFTNPETGKYKFLYTTNIKNHPITEGINKITYPGLWNNMGGFVPDDSWTILIKGEDTTKTRVLLYTDVYWGEGEYTYESNPPLLAVRNYGAGRIVIFPINYVLTVQGGYGAAKGVILEKGNVRKLLENIFDWLAEPSLASDSVGGFDGSTFEEIPVYDFARVVPVEYQRVEKTIYQGIIGVRSSYSEGKNTVKELCDKAKELNLNYLAFTEDFTAFDQTKWDEYLRELDAQRDNTFIALHGFDYEDTWGVKWIAFDFTGDFSTVDKKNFGWQVLWQGWPPIAPINMSTLPETIDDIWGSLHAYTCVPIRVYDKGKILDDSEDKYLYLTENGYWHRPLTVHKCYTVEDLEQAVASDSYKTFALSPSIEQLYEAFHRTMVDYPNGNAIYVSNGPEIREFLMVGEDWTMDLWEYFYLYRPGDITKLYIDVASNEGLSEVLLMKGSHLHRRYLPDAKEFKTTIDWIFEDGGNPYLIVKDRAGKIAISYSLMMRMDTFWANVCADLFNMFAANIVVPVEKGGFGFRGEKRAQWGGGVWSVIGTAGAFVGTVVIPEDRSVYEGAASDTHELSTVVNVGYLDSPTVRTEDRSIILASSPTDYLFDDAEFQKQRFNYQAQWTPWDQEKLKEYIEKDFSLITQLRNWRYLYPPGKQGTDTVTTESIVTTYPVPQNEYNYLTVEQTLRFKKDVLLDKKGTLQICMLILEAESGLFPNCTILNPEGSKITLTRSENPVYTGKLNKDGYVALWPQEWGCSGLFVLDDNTYDIEITDRGILAGFTLPGKKISAGTTYTTKFLLIRDNASFEKDEGVATFANAYGITSSPAYQLDIHKGSIIDDVFTLDAMAKDGVFDAKIVDNKLPTQLIINVNGVNGNLPAYYFNKTNGDNRIIGVYKDTATVIEKLGENDEIVIGNIVTCNEGDVLIDLIESPDNWLTFDIHNPTDEDKLLEIETNSEFSFLPQAELTVSVKAGSSVKVTLYGK